jgi:hypothetical protein
VNHTAERYERERTHGVTWGQLTGLEPRLDEVLWKARAGGAHCHCREDVMRVFVPVRNALADLVGFLGVNRDHPVLGSVGAYEVAYWRLYDAVAGLLPRPSVEVPDTDEAGREEAAVVGELVEVH